MGKYGARKNQDEETVTPACLSYLIFLFNFIFMIGGGTILAIGVWTLIDKQNYLVLLTSSTYAATSYILICTGGFVFIVAIFGCCAAIRENRACLKAYIAFLTLIFTMELIVGVVGIVYKENIRTELYHDFRQTFLKTYDVNEDKTVAIDTLQQYHKCCGAVNFTDWQDSEWRKTSGNVTVPQSCCKTMRPPVTCGIRTHASNIYNVEGGCISKFADVLEKHILLVGAMALGISFLQLFGILLTCCMLRKLEKEDLYY